MLEKLIKEAVTEIVGKQAADIIDFLDHKKYINEFLIAKKMNAARAAEQGTVITQAAMIFKREDRLTNSSR